MPFNIFKRQNTILAIDPGTANFACCVIENDIVVYSNMFVSPLHSMKDDDQIFFKEFVDVLDKYKPNEVIVERFLIRRFLTPTVETVSYMIGMMRTECKHRGIKFHKITAAQWKLSIKKFVELDALYALGHKEYKLPPHPIDAMLIGKYLSNHNSFYLRDKAWIHANIKRCVKTFVKVKKCTVNSKSISKTKRKKNANKKNSILKKKT